MDMSLKYVKSQKTGKYVPIKTGDKDYNTKFALTHGALLMERRAINTVLGDSDYKMLDLVETLLSNHWINTDDDLEGVLDYIGFDAKYFIEYLEKHCMEYFDKELYEEVKDNCLQFNTY
jgi:hypothetical protein